LLIIATGLTKNPLRAKQFPLRAHKRGWPWLFSGENAMKQAWQFAVALGFACLTQMPVGCGWAQGFPARPVRLVVPTSAGSGFDVIGRIVAGGLTEIFGQQVLVENRVGAAANIGAEFVARAAPDGYTLLEISATHVVNRSLYANLPYDLVRDFAPVTQLAASPSVVVVHPSLPVHSIADLVRLARARPGAINYSSTGMGSATFLAAELFKAAAGVNLVHVPYRGGGEALTAVVAGEVPVYFAPFATAVPQIRQKRIRPLAMTSAARLAIFPEYPTVAEAGYPGYESSNWYGIVAPVKTPREIIATIQAATVEVLKKPAVSKRLADLGYIIVGDQPEQFAAHIKSEIDKLGRILRELRVPVE
jgi:tripartite-type tricarboxylate transporter receptor subunit TctC